MSQTFTDRVSANAGALSPTEQRLVSLIMEDRESCAFASVGDIAGRAKAHASALVRLSRKLGYTGFPALRGDIQSELIQRRSTDKLVQKRLDDTGDKNFLGRLIEREIEALNQVMQRVDQSALDAPAAAILAASRVFILAEGTAEALARHAVHRLRRAGVATIEVHPDARAVAECAGLLKPGDVVLGFALREVPSLVKFVLDHARESEAQSVLISDLSGLLLRPAPDHLLAASRGSEGKSGTLTVPMTILNALILTIASKGAPETLNALSKYSKLRDTAQ